MTCVICDQRPAKNNGFCHNCNSKLESSKRQKQAEQPIKYATYRGIVVGFYRNGGDKLIPKLLKRSPESLPKNKTLNLNTYLEGFTREQIKKLKAAILQLTYS